MSKNNLNFVHECLNLVFSQETVSQSINIGNFTLEDDEDIIIHIVNQYYQHILNIYMENEKLLTSYDKLDPYDAFANQTKGVIKAKFFPTYKNYCDIFHNFYRRETLFDKLTFIPSSGENDRKAFISRRKETKEDYIKFVKQYAPKTILNKINTKIPLYIHHKYTEKSVYISGKSGSGKTEILKTMILSNIAQNNSSVIILDIHGDYSLQIAQIMEDKSRLVYIDLFEGDDYNVMPSINPFEISDRTDETLISYASQNISNTLKAIIGSEFSLIMEALLAPMLNTILRIEHATLYDLYKFCDDDINKDLVEFGIQNCDAMNAHYLKYDFYKADTRTKKALKTRLQLLLNHEKFAKFLTGKSTVNLQEAMNSNKVIIFRFNKVKLREAMSPIGRFIVSFVQTYAMLRESLPEETRPSTYMYIDEMQNFINESIDEILSESRKYKLYLIMAHQFLSQIENPRIKESILTNTQLKITGMNAYAHNQAMSKQFGVKLEELETLRTVGEFYFRKNNDKAFKFTSSTKLLHINLSAEELKEWHFGARKEQLTQYYNEVVKKESLFTKLPQVPTETKQTEKKKEHYSKNTKNELLSYVLDDDNEDDELLEF